jgi:hypothetical protein
VRALLLYGGNKLFVGLNEGLDAILLELLKERL